MDSEQLPTPESEEPKPVHREANGAPTATDSQNMLPKETSILYKVRWEDTRDSARRQEFVSEVPLGPLEVTTESFDGTTLVENPPSSLPAIEVISQVEGNVPRTTLLDDTTTSWSDESGSSNRSIPVRNRRRPRAKPYRAPRPPGAMRPPMEPGSDTERIIVEPRRRNYPPVAFEDITITEVFYTKIKINSKDLLEAIRGVVKYYPPNRLTGDSVEIIEPYVVLVHHLAELGDLQRQLGQEFDALWNRNEV